MFTFKISENTIEKFADFVNATVQSNALIVYGHAGVGKRYIVENFIKKQLKIDQLLHHDLLWLDISDSGAQAERVRKINDFFYKTSYRDKAKYIVINEAEKLNVFAYNSLLKILEEPIKNTIFILISSHYKLLPATIKSRCIKAKVVPPSKEESFQIIQSYCTNVYNDEIHKYAYLANYMPFRALKFIDKSYLLMYETLLDIMFNLIENPQDSFKECDKFFKDIDRSWLSYVLNHILTKAILSITKREYFESPIEKERKIVDRILYLHSSAAELLLLEEKVKALLIELSQANLNAQNVFLIVMYKLIYR